MGDPEVATSSTGDNQREKDVSIVYQIVVEWRCCVCCVFEIVIIIDVLIETIKQ